MKTFVLDTNIILDNPENIYRLYNNENNIIIPDIVIDELDSKKSGLDELGYRSREFARLLDSLEVKETIKEGNLIVNVLENDRLKLYIVSKNYRKYDDTHQAIINDRKIIECAKECQKHFKNLIFISLDTMCRLRALSEGLNVETLTLNTEEKNYLFSKEVNFDLPTDNMDIFELDPEHKPENYNYIINESNGNIIIGRCVNNKLQIINEKNLEKQDIRPLNLGQKFYVDAILDEKIDIVLSEATSGSGKSLMALATAMRLINEKKYSGIVYIRNSIESTDKGEDVGYLSGNEEKFAVYNHPLYDCITMIAQKQLQSSNSNKSKAKKVEIDAQVLEERTEELIKRYNIETMWVGELRGRTIQNKVVIFDECLHKDQKIETNKGLLSPLEIEKLLLNDEWVKLKSVNLKTKEIEYKNLLSLKKEHISDTKEKMFKIKLEDGSEIMVTSNHKLFLNGKYTKIKDILKDFKSGKEINFELFK